MFIVYYTLVLHKIIIALNIKNNSKSNNKDTYLGIIMIM